MRTPFFGCLKLLPSGRSKKKRNVLSLMIFTKMHQLNFSDFPSAFSTHQFLLNFILALKQITQEIVQRMIKEKKNKFEQPSWLPQVRLNFCMWKKVYCWEIRQIKERFYANSGTRSWSWSPELECSGAMFYMELEPEL